MKTAVHVTTDHQTGTMNHQAAHTDSPLYLSVYVCVYVCVGVSVTITHKNRKANFR